MINLTAQSKWEYRIIPQAGIKPDSSWNSSLPALQKGLVDEFIPLPLPAKWQAFSIKQKHFPIQKDPEYLNHCAYSREILNSIPKDLTLIENAGRVLDHEEINSETGFYDLIPVFGNPRVGRVAMVFSELELKEDCEVSIFAGADWWMQLFIDGKEIFNTLATGNKTVPITDSAHRVGCQLPAGRHILAMRVLSGNGGWGFALEAFKKAAFHKEKSAPAHLPEERCDQGAVPASGRPGNFALEGRKVFSIQETDKFCSLTFTGSEYERPLLNNHEIPVPLENMDYRTIHGLNPSLLNLGENMLYMKWGATTAPARCGVPDLRVFNSEQGKHPINMKAELFGLEAKDAEIISGPVLHTITENSTALTCRTNVPLPVTLKINGLTQVSTPGLNHRFFINDLPKSEKSTYAVSCEKCQKEGTVKTLGLNLPLNFAVFGDPSPEPQTLKNLLNQVYEKAPDFAVMLGDLTSDGRQEWNWEEQLFSLNPDFFAEIPLYTVVGNHENNCEIFKHIFSHSGEVHNWQQQLGKLLMVGIDGSLDWSDHKNLNWLKKVLTESNAEFRIIFNHYPAFTATCHGRLDAAGKPKERPVKQAREFILPLAAENGVDIIFNGHSHCYERSEYHGIKCITTGGAGGYLYPQGEKHLHPNLEVYRAEHHYCLVNIENHKLTVKVKNLDGNEIDKISFNKKVLA